MRNQVNSLHMSEWISWRGKLALVTLPKGFLVLFLAKQYSHIG